MRGSHLVALAILACASSGARAEKPPSPDDNVPALTAARVYATCVQCDAPFDTDTHKRLLEGLAKNEYVAELRKALFVQDKIHQFESKAHFDNCDFDSAVAYIDGLLNDLAQRAAAGATARQSHSDPQPAIKQAFYALGQAMHGVQDFYAHSNYVELAIRGKREVTDIDILPVWQPEGHKMLATLRAEGLISGYVVWGFPQCCQSGAPTHGELAKDSPNTKSGQVRVAHLRNVSQYKIAEFLAREASLALVRYAFKRWPILKEMNGNDIAFEVILDRRGM